MTNIKGILTTIGIAGLLANSITLTITFFYAYFNNYRVLVTVNSMGEANIEAVILIAINLLGIWAWIRIINKATKRN